MADENEDLDFTQNNDNNNNNQDPVDVGKQLDKDLESFIQQTGVDRGDQGDQTDQTRTGRQNQGNNQTTQQTQRGQGQGQDRGQQTGQDGQNLDQTTGFNTPTQTPRQYGTYFRSDTRGNIVDANGAIIAKSGAQRSAFEKAYRIFRGVEQELVNTQTRIKAIDDADVAAKQAGLTPEERALGQRLIVAWKQDKAGTIKYLLRQAQESGIDISGISQGGGGPTIQEVRQAVTEIVGEHLKAFQPFIDNLQQQKQVDEWSQQAQEEVNQFYEDFPQARMHNGIVAAIMERTGGSMREAWAELRVAAAQHGWDLSKDLQQQAQATVARNPTGGRGNNQQRLPAMNGRANVNGSVPANRRQLANVDDDWESIVQGAVADVMDNLQ